MSYPRGVWIDDQANGNVYMNNTRGANIKRYDSNGNYLGQFGTEGSGTGQYFYSRGIVGNGNPPLHPGQREPAGSSRPIGSGNVRWTRPCGTRGSSFVLLGCTSAAVDASGNIYTAGVVDNANLQVLADRHVAVQRVYARKGPARDSSTSRTGWPSAGTCCT